MLEGVREPVTSAQSEGFELCGRSDALIVQVVNRVNRTRRAEVVGGAQPGMEIDWQQRGVPVVCVHDVGRDAEHLACSDHGTAEKRVALHTVVVAVVSPGVDRVAIEEVIVRHQIQRDVCAWKAGPQVRRFGSPICPQDLRRRQCRFDRFSAPLEPVAGLAVEGHEDHDVVAELRQRFWK